MNGIDDTDDSSTIDEGGELDPREAARIAEQTAMQARRQFETASPLAAVLGAGVFLFGYGAVWFSMLDQRVYTGPAGWSIALLYGLVVVAGIVGSLISRRAVSGVGGRARRQMRALAAAVWSAGIGAWMVEGSLRYLGVSFRIVYGVYGPTVPLIALAAAGAGYAAAQEKWPELGLAMAVIFVASGSTFFGPLGAWGLTGVGCCLALVVYAAVLPAWLRRPPVVRP
jgi:protein-S-isoprenylcysteine O-methyltransferase Ste14